MLFFELLIGFGDAFGDFFILYSGDLIMGDIGVIFFNLVQIGFMNIFGFKIGSILFFDSLIKKLIPRISSYYFLANF